MVTVVEPDVVVPEREITAGAPQFVPDPTVIVWPVVEKRF